LLDFYVTNNVQLVASLPCYSAENVDKQRGNGTFSSSIMALTLLNQKGYGISPTLSLHLVYNPINTSLPGDQRELEIKYKSELKAKFGIVFNELFCISNMPIKRFHDYLSNNGLLEGYLGDLEAAFNPSTVEKTMCRSMININWNGSLYDCDFNQALEVPLDSEFTDIWKISTFHQLKETKITTGIHCYGCTAGKGSS